MSARPYMKLFIADYLGDTQHLTTEQHGAYLLLLMAMWRFGGRLPNDPAKLARIVRLTPRRWGAVADEVMAFFMVDDDEISQKRLTQEYQKIEADGVKKSTSGKTGAEAKALKRQQLAQANAGKTDKQNASISESIVQIPEKEEKAPPDGGSKKRGTRLPDEWTADLGFAVTEGMPVADAEREADKFRDYWRGRAGREGVKLDWDATWRNWVRKAAEHQRPKAMSPAGRGRIWDGVL